MSKKNIARSVMEGGRDGYSRFARRYSNVVLRRQEQAEFSRVRDREDGEEVGYPRREPAYRSFADKLRPAFRWLEAQVNRPWDKVRGELTQRFDTRTTAGRHILFDHVIPAMEPTSRFSHYGAVYVDANGFLRRKRLQKRKRRQLPVVITAADSAWLGGRSVVERGRYLFWMVPTESGAFRQARRLSDDEVARYRGMTQRKL